MSSDCFVFVEEQDSFRMWQGLVGPHYTPAVDSLGNLSWTNDGNLVNPPTVNVSGRGLTVTGIVDTSGDLPETAPQYTCYLVGTTSPYHAYIFDGTSWTDLGIVGKGDKGDTGNDGFSPVVTVTTITGGHEVSIEDANGTQTFDVMDGQDGAPGEGVPSGGTDGQMLVKDGSTDYATKWQNQPTVPSAYTSNPEMDGTASPGSSGSWAAGDHVHPHDSLIVRANLLDNWYFVGGGTGAYGTFPVNQRGQASYSTNEAYTIDRWKLRVEMGGSCAVGANGVTITGNSGGSTVISQTFLNGGKALSGKKVTFSVWVTEKTGGVKMFACNASGPVYFGTQLASKGVEVGLNTLTVDIPATLSNPYLNFMVGDTSSAISFTLAAAKLEIGDTQTLAHQESGAWVLNEMPDYGEQLQKCMAYFAKVQAATGTWDMILPAFAISATRCRAVVPLSVPLRGFPIVTDYGAFQVTPTADINNGFSVTDISIQVQTIVGLVINIDVASGLTAGENYFLRNNNSTSAYFTISAEP